MKEQLLMIRSLVLLVGLMALGVEDLWKKQISSLPLILMAVAGGVLSVVTGDWKDWMVILRFLPGSITLLLAWLTKESIGYGDALVLLCMGCFLPTVQILNLCMCALTMSGIWALFLLLVRKKNRKTQIPFVPFLLAAYGIVIL
ncbi:MAG: hypothetical protein ACI4FX_07345 [Agathobacter sp.]